MLDSIRLRDSHPHPIGFQAMTHRVCLGDPSSSGYEWKKTHTHIGETTIWECSGAINALNECHSCRRKNFAHIASRGILNGSTQYILAQCILRPVGPRAVNMEA